jgi:hypothetical protein
MTLTTHHLHFTCRAATPLALDDQAGAQIRGALANALWDRFCANKAAPACAACPLVRVCPVAALVAPLRDDEQKGGEQRPRPYVVRPPAEARRFDTEEELAFEFALFGQAAHLFPYVVMAAQALEESGLGRRLPELNGRRGRLHLRQIDSLDPLTGARQTLLRPDSRQVHAPGLPVSPEAVAAYAARLPTERLTLHFRTPLRLIDDGRLVRQLSLRPLVQRLMRRLDDLSIAYGAGPLPLDFRALLDVAAQVQVADDQTRWVDVVSFSSRQQRRTPIGGLLGKATFVGPLAELRELLVWGSLVHVGKNAVKGDGWFSVGA